MLARSSKSKDLPAQRSQSPEDQKGLQSPTREAGHLPDVRPAFFKVMSRGNPKVKAKFSQSRIRKNQGEEKNPAKMKVLKPE
jgi:hypothetical protein